MFNRTPPIGEIALPLISARLPSPPVSHLRPLTFHSPFAVLSAVPPIVAPMVVPIPFTNISPTEIVAFHDLPICLSPLPGSFTMFNNTTPLSMEPCESPFVACPHSCVVFLTPCFLLPQAM